MTNTKALLISVSILRLVLFLGLCVGLVKLEERMHFVVSGGLGRKK